MSVILNRMILLIIIFNSGGIPLFKNSYLTALTLVLILTNIAIQRKYNLSKPVFLFFILFCILIFNFICTYHDQIVKAYFIYLSFFLTALLYLSFYENKKYSFLKDLEKILFLIALYALFSFLLQLFFSSYLTFFSHGDYQARTIFNLAFYPKLESQFIFLRNMGIFWEPGILQIYMNILFFISAFITKNKNLSFLSAFLVLTTFSTTGLFILLTQVLMLNYTIFKNLNLVKKIAILPFLFLITIGLLTVFEQNMKEKIEGASKRSSYARIYDSMTAINIIKAYPICGIGLNNETYYSLQKKLGYGDTKLLASEIENRGGTNAILKIIYQLGLPIAFLLLFFIYRQQLLGGSRLLFFSIIVISLMSEPLLMSPFFLLFLVSGLKDTISKLNYRGSR